MTKQRERSGIIGTGAKQQINKYPRTVRIKSQKANNKDTTELGRVNSVNYKQVQLKTNH